MRFPRANRVLNRKGRKERQGVGGMATPFRVAMRGCNQSAVAILGHRAASRRDAAPPSAETIRMPTRTRLRRRLRRGKQGGHATRASAYLVGMLIPARRGWPRDRVPWAAPGRRASAIPNGGARLPFLWLFRPIHGPFPRVRGV